jgi:hypothetical protein
MRNFIQIIIFITLITEMSARKEILINVLEVRGKNQLI